MVRVVLSGKATIMLGGRVTWRASRFAGLDRKRFTGAFVPRGAGSAPTPGRRPRALAAMNRAGHEGVLLSKYVLKLYVAGSSSRTERAITNIRRICEEELGNRYELVIIDVLENPQLAEDDKILATPTLIKHLPPPLRRVIGDLSDKDKVLLGLEVRPVPDAPSSPPGS
jgi:circadian clock protein KaiB